MPNELRKELVRLLRYEPETGVFTRLVRTKRNAPGTVATTMHPRGYLVMYVRGRQFYAHRLAWLYMHGEWPKNQLDHINENKTDNRIGNLREATSSQNRVNRSRQRAHNTSGHTGVVRYRDRWRADININGKRIKRHGFATKEAALAARLALVRQHYGEFGRS